MSVYNLEGVKGAADVTVDVAFDKCRALWVGVEGDVEVMFAKGGTFVFKGVQGMLNVEAVEVVSTNTTATDIGALY